MRTVLVNLDLILIQPAGGPEEALLFPHPQPLWCCSASHLTWKCTRQTFKHQASFPSYSRAKMGNGIAWGSFNFAQWTDFISVLPAQGRILDDSQKRAGKGRGCVTPTPDVPFERLHSCQIWITPWNLKSLTVLNLYNSYWFPSILFS